jgi:hypothetical protein
MDQAYQRVLNEADAWGEAIVAAEAWALAADHVVNTCYECAVADEEFRQSSNFYNTLLAVMTGNAVDKAYTEVKRKARHLSVAVAQAWASVTAEDPCQAYNEVKQMCETAMTAETEAEAEDKKLLWREAKLLWRTFVEYWSSVAVAARDLVKAISNVRKMVVSRAETMTGTGTEMQPVANSWAFAITRDMSTNLPAKLCTGIQME